MPLKFITIESEQNPQESILTTPAKTVQFPLSEEDQQHIAQMKARLYEVEGVGIAAPQVSIAKRIVGIYIPKSAALLREDVREVPMHVLINPEYEGIESDGKKHDFEACYSVASVMGKVPRFAKIKLRYQDEEGKWIEKVVEGFYARVLQHEIDHLNGLLITHRLTPECVQGDHSRMMKLRRAELPPEKRAHFDALLKKKGMPVED